MTSIFVEQKTNLYKLPSKGIPYKDSSTIKLINGDSVKLRPFLAGDQRNMPASNESDGMMQVFVNQFMKIVEEPKLESYDEFLVSDVFACLYMAKILSYGPEYTRTFFCTGCGAINKDHKFNMKDLDTRTPEDFEKFDEEGNEISSYQFENIEFETTSKKVISYHLPRIKDKKKVDEVLVRWQKNGLSKKYNEAVDRDFLTLIQIIDTIDNKQDTDMNKLKQLEKWTAQDFNELLQLHQEKDTGVIATLPAECEFCGVESEVAMVVTPAFFRPTRRTAKADVGDPVSVSD